MQKTTEETKKKVVKLILSIMVDIFFSRTYDPRLPLKENRSISVS